MNESVAFSDWIPRAMPELRIYERGERRLCMNPDVPAWIVTNEASALLLRLVDGEHSVGEIAQMLIERGILVDPLSVQGFFDQARDMRLFDPPVKRGLPNPWLARKLSAMHLHLTDRCNLKCTYCYRNSHPYIPIRHEPAKFIEMLEFIKPFTTSRMRITYCGGEPLAYPGFREVVEESTRLQFVNEILTNGILITENIADFLALHFDKVKISLDGTNRQTHAITRGDNFDKVLRGILRVAARDVEVIVQVTVTKDNMAEVPEFKKLFPPHVKRVYTPMFPMGRGADEAAFVSNDEFLEVANFVDADEGRVNVPQFFSGQINRSCHAGLSNVSIADTGDVYPCHLFHKEKFHLGNIFHDPFEKIFYGDPLKDYVESMDVLHNNSICKDCEIRFLCGGGCKANTLASTGDFKGVDSYCGFIKDAVLDNLFNSAKETTV
ncbi:MAG TPA: radical SAM protein [Pyrinomonadaceae bacterium]|jgi:radical SAM protein with 4Fe4S-binding SPASM domain|nr:radical SAM protein [Pyrinomonadaceae bacterium]